MSSFEFQSIGATGSTLAAGTAIYVSAPYVQVNASSSTNNAVVLPVNPSAGPYVIRNDGNYLLNVFPGNASAIINGLAAGAAFVIAPNAQCSFVASTSSTQPVIQWYAFGYMGPLPVIPITAVASTTLTVGQSGNTYAVNPGTANMAFTLPAPTIPGLRYDFVLSAVTDGTHTVTISAPSTNLHGYFQTTTGAAGASVFAAVSGSTNLIFGASHVGLAGDRASLISDGTNWCVQAFSSQTTAAITVS